GAAVTTIAPPMRYEAIFPRVGDAGCSWGEMRDRADLIVLWRPRGMSNRPRFRERFLEPAKRRGAEVISVESRFHADDLTVLWLMRGLARGRALAAPAEVVQLVETFKKARYGVICYHPRGPFTVGVRALSHDLNRGRRFRCIPIGDFTNSAGERQV